MVKKTPNLCLPNLNTRRWIQVHILVEESGVKVRIFSSEAPVTANVHPAWYAEPRVVLILDREQDNGGTGKVGQVALTELREGLVGSALQGVIEIVVGGCGEPSRHAQLGRVSRDILVDLIASTPELTVWATMTRGSLRVAETVEHVPE
jgi:hypothetical protein